MEHPLYFFFDVETTGPGPLDDHIIEMAATAANPDGVIQENTFYSLVFTDRQISPAGIQANILCTNGFIDIYIILKSADMSMVSRTGTWKVKNPSQLYLPSFSIGW